MGKTRVLTLIEKVNIIREYLRTMQTVGLAKMFNCHRGQVHHILKHKDEYLADWLTTRDPNRTRRPRCKVLNALGLILHEWVLRCRRHNVMVNDAIIKLNSVEIAKVLNYRLFKPNPKWYSRFKLKYKLDNITNWREWRSIDDGVQPQSLDLEDIINDLRTIHGESVIPNYVQLNDEEFKDFTVRCYGGQNVAEKLGELLRNPETTATVNVDLTGDQAMEEMEDSSNSYGGYVPYTGSDSDEPFAAVSIDHDESGYAVNGGGNLSACADVNDVEAKPIRNYREALNVLGPLEQFALFKENVRAVGLINQLEIIFQEQMKKELNQTH